MLVMVHNDTKLKTRAANRAIKALAECTGLQKFSLRVKIPLLEVDLRQLMHMNALWNWLQEGREFDLNVVRSWVIFRCGGTAKGWYSIKNKRKITAETRKVVDDIIEGVKQNYPNDLDPDRKRNEWWGKQGLMKDLGHRPYETFPFAN